MDTLNRAAAKAATRRFTGEPLTGFGDLELDDDVDTRDELQRADDDACDRADAANKSAKEAA